LGKAKCTLQIDNDRVRVTRWDFDDGDETGWHRHEMDYVIVPSGDGTLRLLHPDGLENRAELSNGVSYFRAAGVEHNVINDSGQPFAFVEIELK